MTNHPHDSVIIESSIESFFQDLVHNAVENQKLDASQECVRYLIHLLSTFAHSEALFDSTPDGPMIQPLALLYGQAFEEPDGNRRNQTLKRLGDVALFVSGIFSDSLNRKVVDVGYYIAMGGSAYGHLSHTSRHLARWQSFRNLFCELATNFAQFVAILHEVGDQTGLQNDQDIMRLYEVWQQTGSRHIERKLQRFGINPVHGSESGHPH